MNYSILERDAYRERMFLKGIILLFTALFLGTFFWVALHRLNYLFELEWREGIFFESALRILEGKSLYASPAIEWIGPDANPLFIYISSGLLYLFGESISVLRMVSLLATIGTAFLFYRFLRKTGVEDYFALIGFGIFFSVYFISGNWYDIANPFSLAIFLSLASLTAAIKRKKKLDIITAGVFSALAFFAHTDFILLFIFLLFYYLVFDKKYKFYFIISASVVFLAFFVTLHIINGEWYWKYAFSKYFVNELKPSVIFSFWYSDLFSNLPIFSILSWGGLIGLIRLYVRRNCRKSDHIMTVMIAAMFSISIISRLYGEENSGVLTPAFIGIAGLTVWSMQHFHLREYGLGWFLPIAVKIMIIVQLSFLVYRPSLIIPTESDLKSGELLIEKIENYSGQVFVPYHPYYSRLAGKNNFADFALSERFTRSGYDPAFQSVSDSLQSMIEKQRFSAIFIDYPPDYLPDYLTDNYRLGETLHKNQSGAYPITGFKTRPQFVYIPR